MYKRVCRNQGLQQTLSVLLSAVEIPDLLGPAGMAQLPDGLILDLADTLTGNTKDLAHFLQGVGTAVVHTEPHPQHVGPRISLLFNLSIITATTFALPESVLTTMVFSA